MPTVDGRGQVCRRREFGNIESKSHGTVIKVCGCMTMASILNAVGVDARCGSLRGTSQWIAIATIIIDVFQIEGMDVSGEVARRYG